MFELILPLFRQMLPEDGKFPVLNQYQFRALRPTWPVAISILFVSLGFLVPDQGRAIVKYTIGQPLLFGSTSFADFIQTLATYVLLVLHALVMMYTAFMLSAVTRRGFIDADSASSANGFNDPVDPSVSLRLRYAYICGVFLSLQFLAMSIWMNHALDFAFLALVSASALIAALLFWQVAGWLSARVSAELAPFAYPGRKETLGSIARYRALRVVDFVTTPEHRRAQTVIFAIFGILITLTVQDAMTSSLQGPDEVTHTQGAWRFFICFLVIHILFRLLKDRVVTLHYGQSARYIILDRVAERTFSLVRWAGLIVIPITLWVPAAVDFLGPLGIALFGTLWVTLFFSGLVESAARYTRSDTSGLRLTAASRTEPLSARSWFFLALVGLLLIELAVSAAEWAWFRPSGQAIGLASLLLALGLIILVPWIAFRSPRLPEAFKPARLLARFSETLNRLPSLVVVAPVLMLSLGEAHVMHRVPVGDDPPGASVLDMETHAADWLAARPKKKGQPVTAIVVLAEGGGIRAAAHVGYFLDELDTQLRSKCATPSKSTLCVQGADTRLIDHIYSINGVSGGSIGSAVYLAALKEERDLDLSREERFKVIDATLRGDFISPLFAGLFGSDLQSTIFPAHLPDRIRGLFNPDWVPQSDLIERGFYDRADFFEDRLAGIFHAALPASRRGGRRSFDLPLEDVGRGAVSDRPGDPGPIVLFSTFYESGGYQMATSNVDIVRAPDDCERPLIVQQMLNGRDTEMCSPRTSQTLALSTAAHLSARFPGSNPTGVLETRASTGRWKRHHFVDGGYLDNSGALTALRSIEALRNAANGKRPVNINGKRPVNIIVLHVFTKTVPTKAGSGPGVEHGSKQQEFSSVVSALAKARGAAGRIPVETLCAALRGEDAANGSVCSAIANDRSVSDDALSEYTPERLKDALDKGDPIASDLIRHQRLKVSGGCNAESAHWISAPLEVAQSDRQTNAVTALLGWTLLSQTNDDIRKVMAGTSRLSLEKLTTAVAVAGDAAACDEPGSPGALRPDVELPARQTP